MNVPSLEALADFPLNLTAEAERLGPLLASVNDEPVDDAPVAVAR